MVSAFLSGLLIGASDKATQLLDQDTADQKAIAAAASKTRSDMAKIRFQTDEAVRREKAINGSKAAKEAAKLAKTSAVLSDYQKGNVDFEAAYSQLETNADRLELGRQREFNDPLYKLRQQEAEVKYLVENSDLDVSQARATVYRTGDRLSDDMLSKSAQRLAETAFVSGRSAYTLGERVLTGLKTGALDTRSRIANTFGRYFDTFTGSTKSLQGALDLAMGFIEDGESAGETPFNRTQLTDKDIEAASALQAEISLYITAVGKAANDGDRLSDKDRQAVAIATSISEGMKNGTIGIINSPKQIAAAVSAMQTYLGDSLVYNRNILTNNGKSPSIITDSVSPTIKKLWTPKEEKVKVDSPANALHTRFNQLYNESKAGILTPDQAKNNRNLLAREWMEKRKKGLVTPEEYNAALDQLFPSRRGK